MTTEIINAVTRSRVHLLLCAMCTAVHMVVYVNRERVTARYFLSVSVKRKRRWPPTVFSPRPTITAAARRPPVINSFEPD